MTHHNLTIEAFVKLGDFLRIFCENLNSNNQPHKEYDKWISQFLEEVEKVKNHNGWFTKENIVYAFSQWSTLLTKEELEKWLSNYTIDINLQKTIAIIMAGNIPLVGFHDLLAVLVTGNKALVKLSSNDKQLTPLLIQFLIEQEPTLADYIKFTTGKISNFDAVIATGSNNTARYFEYYFGKKPNIIRRNRNSVAVLDGNETPEQLHALGEDIFRYFGLGCRSISKLFVPKGYDFDQFFNAIYPYNDIVNHHKYANNYDYNKAVYLMSSFKILDNGFLILKEDESYASPIATLFYEFYENKKELENKLEIDSNKLQCIVAGGFSKKEIDFGKTQNPSLSDYADGVDTVDFILKTDIN